MKTNGYYLRTATKRDKNKVIEDYRLNKYREFSKGKWWICQYFKMSFIERRRLNNLDLEVGHIFYDINTRNFNRRFK